MIRQNEQKKAVGVVICDGGGSLAKGLDTETLMGRVRELSGVIEVRRCSTLSANGDGIAVLKDVSKAAGRVVVARLNRLSLPGKRSCLRV